ncbi:anti-sigma-K factor RskA [Conyzicola lurida]|uniref:Regulator of SigK n=1 Tax=Conyzicola lurida TaxID=1172621 RepID=A0A841AI00_9MICO|nr:anti-sigma factor [Conyzicola lurida]MBB5841968.1 anti-sigma-K factor RskA [Conyzicola lurida]
MTDDKLTPADDVATLTGAYVLNALSAEERLAFEAKLGESESLRHEVTELADTAVLLGRAVAPVEPPAALKASIMGLIASTPQLPAVAPVVSITSKADAAAAVEAPAAVASATPTFSPAARKAQVRWFMRPAALLAGVAAAFVLFAGGGLLVTTLNDAQTQRVQADGLAAITSADDKQQAVADVSGGGSATLVWSNELQSSAVIVDGLATLPDGNVYELWYIDGEGPRSAGTFTVSEDGSTWRVLDGEMRAGDTVGVTVEPAGGSEQPTTDPIVAIASA